jgi:hypothetical protein
VLGITNNRLVALPLALLGATVFCVVRTSSKTLRVCSSESAESLCHRKSRRRANFARSPLLMLRLPMMMLGMGFY